MRMMHEENEVVVIQSYALISSRISRDLSWYLVYEAVMTAKEALRLDTVTMDLPDNKSELYRYALKVYLQRAIHKHLFPRTHVELTMQGLQEAMEHFALSMPLAPTFKLATYLNYLESWAREHTDWTSASPEAFDNLEFELSL